MGGLLGGPKGMLPPPTRIIGGGGSIGGGGAGPPLPTPMKHTAPKRLIPLEIGEYTFLKKEFVV